jgi:signal transduction histidine kinase
MVSLGLNSSKDFWRSIINPIDPVRRRWLVGLTVALLLVIGLADFLVGFEISMLVFYFLPVSFAVVALGWRFGVAIALASVTIWIGGDLAAGARYSTQFVPEWNACIALGTYLVLIWLLSSLLALHREMEERVRLRTAALTKEIAERERLERAILEIGERERRGIGRDLHDGLGQHLTGTALEGQILSEKLESRNAEEAGDARRVVGLVNAAIDQTRRLAKGLLLEAIEPEGLRTALEELAATTAEQFRVDCAFRCEGEVTLNESGPATHLYRIAQEAVRNALRHGKPRRIEVILAGGSGGMVLSVCDDGAGLPPTAPASTGLGLRIMAHRAMIIGASFSIETPSGGGTAIVCRLPRTEAAP